jgi:tRNA C32,U32 (ribose-2'-O)-methylase TrmJ
MVSRAMSNFGFSRLLLIDPQCELDRTANQGAAQGQQPLRDCIIYPSWEEYAEAEGDTIRVALSRREGRRRPVQRLSELEAWGAWSDNRSLTLIFGAEDHGLSRDDLKWAHRTCSLDIPGPLKSMNLSHAVLLALSQLPARTQSPPDDTQPALLTPDDALKKWLLALQFDLSKKNWNAYHSLRQMVMKAAPTEREIELFNSVVEQTVRRLKNGE